MAYKTRTDLVYSLNRAGDVCLQRTSTRRMCPCHATSVSARVSTERLRRDGTACETTENRVVGKGTGPGAEKETRCVSFAIVLLTFPIHCISRVGMAYSMACSVHIYFLLSMYCTPRPRGGGSGFARDVTNSIPQEVSRIGGVSSSAAPHVGSWWAARTMVDRINELPYTCGSGAPGRMVSGS